MKKLICIIFFFNYMVTGSIFSQCWVQKMNYSGAGRHGAVGFSIGNKGYIGLGNDMSLNDFNDFWEWNQKTNTWRQISNFPGNARESASGFSIGNKGYVVMGYGTTSLKELWEWDGDTTSPNYDTWSRKADFPGSARIVAVAFSIGKKGYVGTGSMLQDFWEWDGDTASPTYNTWTRKADFGGGPRGWATGFTVGNKGYIGTGTDGSQYKKDFWEWDGDTASPTYNTWIQISDLPGGDRISAVGLSIGNKGYAGMGLDSTHSTNLNDFWYWNQSSNTWIQKPNFGGTGRQETIGFSIGSLGYVGTGYDNTSTNDFWEYCDTCQAINIKEFESPQTVSIYPNPTNSILNVTQKKFSRTSEIFITDIYGKEMKKAIQVNENTKIDISSLSDGIYFVTVKTPDSPGTQKIVVQH